MGCGGITVGAALRGSMRKAAYRGEWGVLVFRELHIWVC